MALTSHDTPEPPRGCHILVNGLLSIHGRAVREVEFGHVGCQDLVFSLLASLELNRPRHNDSGVVNYL